MEDIKHLVDTQNLKGFSVDELRTAVKIVKSHLHWGSMVDYTLPTQKSLAFLAFLEHDYPELVI